MARHGRAFPLSTTLRRPAGFTDSGTTVTPATVAVITSVPPPAISTESTLTPTTVAVVTSVPAPSITAETATTPSTVAVITSVPAPSLSTDSIFIPITVAVVTSVPAPSITTEAVVSPATVVVITSVPAPTVSSVTLITPATVAVVTSIPAPALSVESVVARPTVAVVVSIPTPIVSSGIIITPATVAVVASIPAPLLTVQTVVSRPTVAVVASIPAPLITTPVCAAGYGGMIYGGVPYAGGNICEIANAVFDTLPANIEEVSTSQGRLGCGVPSVYITNRCGSVFCVLGADDSISDLRYDRRLDEISEAEVVIQLGGDSTSTCCECLAQVEPWCHELWIQRDGIDAWAGPITEIIYGYSTVTIRAMDRLAWATVRISEGTIDYESIPAADLAIIGEDILQVAFSEDTVTCELDAMYVANTGEVQNWFGAAFEKNAYEQLTELSERGLDFTTIAGTISLTGDLSSSGRALALLTDELIFGDIEVKKSGLTQGNRWYVNFDGDLGVPAISDVVSEYCYGAIERQRTGDDILVQAQAVDVANAYALAAGIAPRTIEIPPGSRLSPDTPWLINDMICGVRVDVSITKLCVSMVSSFRLTSVEVDYSAGEEEILITLSPLNSLED